VTRTAGVGVAAILFALAACSGESVPAPAATVASRVVTLAPNLAELVYAAGAGDTLVGVSAYSDYPPAVRTLPQVGDAFLVDREQLTLLEPDLVLAWQSGTPEHVVDELRAAGFRVETIRTRSLEDVATAMRRIGALTGFSDVAAETAVAYSANLQRLRDRHAGDDGIRVFYQVSARPLYTVGGRHYVSELIRLCGGRNVFADLEAPAPAVDVEAVVERDPEVLLASTDAGRDAFDEWRRWPAMAANRYDNRFLMPADEIGRATPRLAAAGKAVCDALDEARVRRAAGG
jgi:iron complex transport system substrate-binding protein